MKRRSTRKRLRKQPRRMTPPLVLRNHTTGEVSILDVDQDFTTPDHMHSRRTTAILMLAPGIHVTIGSRCINKRRVPVLMVRAA